MANAGARPDERRITPHLIVRGSAEAVEFYQRAFGAVVLYRSPMPDGKGVHAQLRICDSVLMITEESTAHPQMTMRSPRTFGGSTTILELYVDDVDAAYERLVAAGARPILPPTDTFFGDRYGQAEDPFGHVWALATVREVLTPEEVAARMAQAHEGG